MTIKNLICSVVSVLRPMSSSVGTGISLQDIDDSDLSFLESFDGVTMTSIERRYHLLSALRYLVRYRIDGAVVECGVWRGGSMMLAAQVLIQLGAAERSIYLFDTFSGMPAPTSVDKDVLGTSAMVRLDRETDNRDDSMVWAIASRSDVEANMRATSYPQHLIHYVEGLVEETIPEYAPESIALLRLDTDWYESTRHELYHLWPRLVKGGIIIIDDYGYWRGARKATDEFFSSLPEPVILHRIDDTCRVAVKIV